MFNIPVLGPFIISRSQFGHHLSQTGNAAWLKKYFSVKLLVPHSIPASDKCYGGKPPPSEMRLLDKGMDAQPTSLVVVNAVRDNIQQS